MKITNWNLTQLGDTNEVSAEVDGYRLWFRVPRSYSTSTAGDPFLACALLPAMSQEEGLDIDPNLPVSETLLRNASHLQEIFHSWNPRQLKIVPIKARPTLPAPPHTARLSFFSGGVDGTYTLLKNLQELSHVVCIHGFDFSFHPDADNASSFSASDINDLALLAHRLAHPSDEVSRYLRGRLSPQTSEAISRYLESGANPRGVEAHVLADLNGVLASTSINHRTRFARVKLRPETQRLLRAEGRVADVRRVNRLLLEDAFPEELFGKYTDTYQAALARNTTFIEGLGKKLIPVQTNHYSFNYRYNLGRSVTHGSLLGAVALLLGFRRAYVPSSYAYNELFPWGSHPLTDVLWSNGCVDVVHDGCEASRAEKLKVICRHESALSNLRVCFDHADTNCGRCRKCVRTMITLKALKVSTDAFPPLPSAAAIRRQCLTNESEIAFLRENIQLAVAADDRDLNDALLTCLRRSERLRYLMALDQGLLGGRLRRAYQTLRSGPRLRRIELTPREWGLGRPQLP